VTAIIARLLHNRRRAELSVTKGKNMLAKKLLTGLQELLPKPESGHILAALTCPPLQEVSKVEIEAGDCEGRLPLRFQYWSWALGGRLLVFLSVLHASVVKQMRAEWTTETLRTEKIQF